MCVFVFVFMFMLHTSRGLGDMVTALTDWAEYRQSRRVRFAMAERILRSDGRT